MQGETYQLQQEKYVVAASRNRGRIDLVADVIRACIGSCSKSTIMVKANLNSVMTTNLIAKLINSGLITSEKVEKIVFYSPTEKGIEFLRIYNRLISYMPDGIISRKTRASII